MSAPTDILLPSVSAYLSWALDADAQALTMVVLAGGNHRNVRTLATVNGDRHAYVLRMAMADGTGGFARQEVVPYDLETEFLALRDLQAAPLPTPRIWGLDLGGRFLGRPVFLMDYLEGTTVLDACGSNPNVLETYVDAIRQMNRISPEQVPSVVERRGVPEAPSNQVDWLFRQTEQLAVPDMVRRGLDLARQTEPRERPAPAFGNGDLGPANFIVRDDGCVAVVDWEFVGFADPLSEIMLLHTWPEDKPFLSRYPIDRMYCQRNGLNPQMLPWYELVGTLCGWQYAVKDENDRSRQFHEHRLPGLLL